MGPNRPWGALAGKNFASPDSQFFLKVRLSLQLRRNPAKVLIMSVCHPAEPPVSACHIYKVGLTVPAEDHVSYCVGLGVGPSEDSFREWLHRRVLLSQIPFLWAQVEPVEMDSGGDLERLLHLLAYAGGCSPFRQVFWSGEEVSLPDSSERFLQRVSMGEVAVPSGGCALLLAGKAIADLRVAAPAPSPQSSPAGQTPACADHAVGASSESPPMPWMAAVMALFATMRRKLACLWMAW
jgi:hypothetical protein